MRLLVVSYGVLPGGQADGNHHSPFILRSRARSDRSARARSPKMGHVPRRKHRAKWHQLPDYSDKSDADPGTNRPDSDESHTD